MITRILNLMDISLGAPTDLMSPAADNPEGFWENMNVVSIHDAILGILGRTWDTVRPLPHNWINHPSVTPYKESLKELIIRETAHSSVWAFKDPRTCLLVPLWQDLCHELHVDLEFVIPWRHPWEVASSLQKRNGFSLQKGLSLWYLYTLTALYSTNDSRRIFVSYEKALNTPAEEIHRLAGHLGIRVVLDERFEEFVKPALRHHKPSTGKQVTIPGKISELLAIIEYPDEPNTVSETLNRLFDEYVQNTEVAVDEPQKPMMQLFYSSTAEFSELRSVSSPEVSGMSVHRYEFPVPTSDASFLRLDPSDRPVLIDVHSLEIEYVDTNGAQFVRRYHTSADFVQLGLVQLEKLPSDSTVRLLALTDDPQIIVPKIENSYPTKVVLAAAVTEEIAEITKSINELLKGSVHEIEQLSASLDDKEIQLASLNRKNSVLHVNLETAQAAVTQLEHALTAKENELSCVFERNTALHEDLGQTREHVAIAELEIKNLKESFARSEAIIKLMEGSISWRVTRPFRWLSSALRRRRTH